VEAVLPPLAEPADGTASGWAPLQAAPAASSSVPAQVPAPTATAVAALTTPACTADCPPEKPKIVEAPGVHAPHAEQLHAAPRVVIGSGRVR